MKELIEKYEIKLKTARTELKDCPLNIAEETRLQTKIECYKAFIAELKEAENSKALARAKESFLQNGIAFILTDTKKLGHHPESKLVAETTIRIKEFILENFEVDIKS